MDEALDWLTLPARNQGAAWLVATARLPDGSWLQVGKTTEALTALLAEFRAIFGWVALIALLLGLAGGVWLLRRYGPARLARPAAEVAQGSCTDLPPVRKKSTSP